MSGAGLLSRTCQGLLGGHRWSDERTSVVALEGDDRSHRPCVMLCLSDRVLRAAATATPQHWPPPATLHHVPPSPSLSMLSVFCLSDEAELSFCQSVGWQQARGRTRVDMEKAVGPFSDSCPRHGDCWGRTRRCAVHRYGQHRERETWVVLVKFRCMRVPIPTLSLDFLSEGQRVKPGRIGSPSVPFEITPVLPALT